MNVAVLSIVENIINKRANIDLLVYVEHVAQCTDRSLCYIFYVVTPLLIQLINRVSINN